MSTKLTQQLRKAFRRQLRIETLEDRRVLSVTPIIVNTTLDTNDAGDGLTTLREAIEQANFNGSADAIEFLIPSDDPGFDPITGVWRIQPLSPLPEITNTVSILGSTQPRVESPVFTQNVIEINGFLAKTPQIRPVSYDAPNGYTGSYEYWDESYSGIGDTSIDGAALTGGLGDLADGIVANDNWTWSNHLKGQDLMSVARHRSNGQLLL